jgi:hypothetical protein
MHGWHSIVDGVRRGDVRAPTVDVWSAAEVDSSGTATHKYDEACERKDAMLSSERDAAPAQG